MGGNDRVDMLLGVIADDFTGAGDVANTLSKGLPGENGLKTTLFLGIPRHSAAPDCEAGVVALKTRSVAAKDAVDQSLRALAWLRQQGCRQFLFKYGSTFDSTVAGNIGPVGEALAEALQVRGVVVCPAFPALGRTIYEGHLFVSGRLLNESGLQHHPLNPMTDADIRRWLGHQTRQPVGHIDWHIVKSGAAVIHRTLEDSAQRGECLVVVDAIADVDLLSICAACRNALLLTGGSGIAMGLPYNFIEAGLATGRKASFSGISGPAVILAGSCSKSTIEQIEFYTRSHPAFRLELDQVMSNTVHSSDILAFTTRHFSVAPLIYSSQGPEDMSRCQTKYGRDNIANALDRLFQDAAIALAAAGVRRFIVAGGETSGAVASALGLGALQIGPEIDPGVPALFTEGPHPIALALKSGNFGSPQFFAKAITALGGR